MAPPSTGSCPSPTVTCASASSRGARRERPLPRRRLPHRRSRGAGRPVWAGARRAARAADPVGLAVGAPAQRRARSQLPAAATPVPLRRRRRHLRAARQRLRQGARRAQRARRPAVRRQRLLERAWTTPPRWPALAGRGGRQAGTKFLFVGRPAARRGWGCCSRPGVQLGLRAPDRRARARRRRIRLASGPRRRRDGTSWG